MTKLAHVTTNQSDRPMVPLLSLPSDGQVQTIYIKVNATNQVSFSLTQDTDNWWCEGLIWEFDYEYGMFINFEFVPGTGQAFTGLTYTTPGFWFSERNGNKQSCFVPPLVGTYTFDINLTVESKATTVLSIDPRIVVTPIIT